MVAERTHYASCPADLSRSRLRALMRETGEANGLILAFGYLYIIQRHY
jgi:hypothetical protein